MVTCGSSTDYEAPFDYQSCLTITLLAKGIFEETQTLFIGEAKQVNGRRLALKVQVAKREPLLLDPQSKKAELFPSGEI